MSAPREFRAGFLAAGIGVGALGFMDVVGRLGWAQQVESEVAA